MSKKDDLSEFGFEPIDDLDDLSEFGFEPVEDSSDPDFSLGRTPKAGDPSQLEAAGRGALQGATFGFGEEAGAAVLSPLEMLRKKAAELIEGTPEHTDKMLREQGFTGDVETPELSETYKELRDVTRGREKAAQEAHGGTYLAGELGGGILPAIASGGATAAASVLKTGAKQALKAAAKTGAKYGAASGAGYSEADDFGGLVRDTAIGTGIGAVAGAGLPLLAKGAKIGAKKTGSMLKRGLESIIPESEAIKAGYKFGKQGKKLTQEFLDEDLKSISKTIIKNIKADKKANNLKAVKEKLDALGYKVDTKKTINDAIDDLEKLTKGDVLELQNKELLPKIKKLAGYDLEGAKLAERAEKQVLKKAIESEGKETQAIIAGEKSLAKKALQTGDDLQTITDVDAPMSNLEIPLTTSEGKIGGVRGKFQKEIIGPDGESTFKKYTKEILKDTTDYQPTMSKILGPDGRPIIKTVDAGSGKVSAMVGNIENKLKLNLKNMKISEVENLRKQLNLATKLAKAQGAADDPIMQRAQQLAGELKKLTDDVVEKSGNTDLITKRSRFSDVFSAEEMLGIDKRLAARSDINEFKQVLSIGDKLGFEKGFKTRQEGELAEKLLGEKIISTETKNQLELIRKLNQISGRESQENISRAGLYKMAVGDIPNLAGRAANKTGEFATKALSPVKTTVEALGKMSRPQLEKMSAKFANSENKGIQVFGKQLKDAMEQEGAAQAQTIWALSQSPAFREMLKREIPRMEEEMQQDLGIEDMEVSDEVSSTQSVAVDPSVGMRNVASEPTDNKESILELVAKAEGTSDARAKKNGYDSGYDVTFSYGKYDPESDKKLTEMTVEEVLDYQKEMVANQKALDIPANKRSSASGRYQIIKPTLLGLIKNGTLKKTDIFNAETQEKAAANLLKTRGYSKFQKGKITQDEFMDNLSKEWASLPTVTTGKSEYDQPTGASLDQVKEALGGGSKLSGILEPYAAQEVPKADIEEVEDAIDSVNSMQSSGDNIPVDQIENLMGKIDALTLNQEDKDEIENEAIQMQGFSDGNRLKELLRKIANLQ